MDYDNNQENTKEDNEVNNISQLNIDTQGDTYNDKCFICLGTNDPIIKANLCCGTTIYHEECMREYINNNNNNLKCAICREDISDKLYKKLNHTLSYEKIGGVLLLLYLIGTCVLSFIYYLRVLKNESSIVFVCMSYIFVPIVSIWIVIGSTHIQTFSRNLQNNLLCAVLTSLYFLPTLLSILSIIRYYNPKLLSMNVLDHIFYITVISIVGVPLFISFLIFIYQQLKDTDISEVFWQFAYCLQISWFYTLKCIYYVVSVCCIQYNPLSLSWLVCTTSYNTCIDVSHTVLYDENCQVEIKHEYIQNNNSDNDKTSDSNNVV